MEIQEQYEEMVRSLKKDGGQLHSEWSYRKASAMHMLVGLFDEYLELMDAHNWYDHEGILEETGDFLFYLTGLEQDLRTSGCQVVEPPTAEPAMLALVGHVKKHLVYGKDLDKDLVHSLCLSIKSKLLNEVGLTFEKVAEHNMEKLLKGRYKTGAYSDEQAISREDKAGT